MNKIFKIFLYNLGIVFSFVLLIEILFGYWFDKDNFGPYMREHRMKNQRVQWTEGNDKVNYFYRRNYYGFRGEDIKPSDIDLLIMGGSVIDERYKPEQYTITGYLNSLLKKDNFNFRLVNGGVEAQSSNGIITGYKNWLFKLKNFSPKFILLYVGINDVDLKEDELASDGHVLNPDAKEVLWDTFKSKSIIYDSLRIFKFKYLPRDGFIKYDGEQSKDYIQNFNFKTYDEAIKSYDISFLEKKYQKKINRYLNRINLINKMSREISSIPIFIANIDSTGHREEIFILNYSLIKYCKINKLNCINLAKKINGKAEYWRDQAHTTRKGSEIIANLIFEDLKKIFLKFN